MIKRVLSAEEPSLKKKSEPVKKITSEIKGLIRDLQDTLRASEIKGVGIAAPQIGINKRVIIVVDSDSRSERIIVMINPEIVSASGEEEGVEGCLCFPHLYGLVKRAKKIKVSYLNEKGKPIMADFEDFNARVIQHEIDHLDGILFVDRVTDPNTLKYEGPVLR